MESILCYSSLVFWTNSIAAYRQKDYPYCALFYFLALTSVYVHKFEEQFFINFVDKLFIFLIFLYGCKTIYKKKKKLHSLQLALILSSFFFCVFVYNVGYFCRAFCFDNNENTSTFCHVLMHLVGSIGHHCILLF
jgi:hypothetical protein